MFLICQLVYKTTLNDLVANRPPTVEFESRKKKQHSRDHIIYNCFPRSQTNELLNMFSGDKDRSKTEGTEQLFNVSDLRIHYNFSTDVDLGNDVALFKLSRKITNTTAVQPISLPKQGKRIAVGKKCYFTGKF